MKLKGNKKGQWYEKSLYHLSEVNEEETGEVKEMGKVEKEVKAANMKGRERGKGVRRIKGDD